MNRGQTPFTHGMDSVAPSIPLARRHIRHSRQRSLESSVVSSLGALSDVLLRTQRRQLSGHSGRHELIQRSTFPLGIKASVAVNRSGKRTLRVLIAVPFQDVPKTPPASRPPARENEQKQNPDRIVTRKSARALTAASAPSRPSGHATAAATNTWTACSAASTTEHVQHGIDLLRAQGHHPGPTEHVCILHDQRHRHTNLEPPCPQLAQQTERRSLPTAQGSYQDIRIDNNSRWVVHRRIIPLSRIERNSSVAA